MTANLEFKNWKMKRGPNWSLLVNGVIENHERVALMGQSGVGKSSVLKSVLGILDREFQTEGSIELGGQEIQNLPADKRNFGYVPQGSLLFPALNVLENVTFALKVRGVKKEEYVERGLKALADVGLRDRAHSAVDILSGGEAQRVAFLRAVIFEPSVLLLDEPFSALDLMRKTELNEMVIRWHKKARRPVLFVTHDENEAQKLGTRSVKMHDGVSNRLSL
jgi:putative spermidine/putrescine transport system ATP-binding protein